MDLTQTGSARARAEETRKGRNPATPLRYSRMFARVFYFALGFFFRARISALRVRGVERARAQLDAQTPLVLVSAHLGWWDGFVLAWIFARLRPGAPLYTIMLERELGPRPFLRLLGGVGIDPAQPRSLLRVLTALTAQKRSDWGVSFFPQGKILPSWARPLRFQPGIQWVLERVKASGSQVQWIPIGMHSEPFTQPSPEIWVSLGEVRTTIDPLSEIELAVQAELDRIQAWIATQGERASVRAADAGFETVGPA